MSASATPLPWRRNLLLAGLLLTLLPALLIAAGRLPGAPALAVIAAAYALAMNSGYALLHEAEHGLLHPRRAVNDALGAALALFFPAPFHLIRQGHLHHHRRNRSDDEAFDLVVPGERPLWKWVQLYGTLTGLFWLTVALGTAVAAIAPRLLCSRRFSINRTTDALFDAIDPRSLRWIRLEAWAAVALHAGLCALGGGDPARHLAPLAAFGFAWSAIQYAHHYGTVRDARDGASNLRTFAWLDRALLNHNWHLNHHRHPTEPWTRLPALSPEGERRERLLTAYLRMWRGPRRAAANLETRDERPVAR